ncbi:MAG: hypothetical protein ACFB4I_11905 [Cyanophyceae cyanobacterium]
MIRRLTALLIAIALCWTTVACSSPPAQASFNNSVAVATQTSSIEDGKYPIQQATYDDATGEYRLMLLNTPPGNPSAFRSTELQMARLTEEQIASGEKSYLEVDGSQTVAYLSEDFKFEYIHNVTDTQINPQTGEPETIIVERRSGFWTPFAGALAGQALGSLLFTPQYYMPPIYQPGGTLSGYGGYGRSYSQAVNRYQSRYQAPPPVVKNRQALRTTGRLRNPATSTRKPINKTRATGSGYGSSNLRSSGNPSKFRKSPSSFGSRYGSRRKSFSGSRRRSRRR